MAETRAIAGTTYLATDAGQILSACGRPLPQSKRGKCYLAVSIDGKKQSVHRLVCTAFHGPPPSNRHETRHLDGNGSNNRAENLTWGTSKENTQDKRLHGTYHEGHKNPKAKLSPREVQEIRERYTEHLTIRKAEGFSRVRRGFNAALVQEFGLCATSYVNLLVGGSLWQSAT